MDFNTLLLIGSGVILPVMGWIFRLQHRVNSAEAEQRESEQFREAHKGVLIDLAVLKADTHQNRVTVTALEGRIMSTLERIERKLDLKADKRGGQ
jgi:Tfp pilus assembly protein PilO